MERKKYQHIEKISLASRPNLEIDGLLNGTCYIFPKIDGTNSQIFLKDDGSLGFGSRNNDLDIINDNRGFVASVLTNEELKNKFLALLNELPKNSIIYGEWLVPHTIKFYKQDAWDKFYIFDVVIFNEDKKVSYYLPYEEYLKLCNKYDLLYIPMICKIENPTIDDLEALLAKNNYLTVNDNVGEGIVIKNYNFKNCYGRITWGKLINADFKNVKDKTHKKNKELKEDAESNIEYLLLKKYVNTDFLNKETNKYEENNNVIFQMRDFSKLLNYAFEEFIKDNILDMIKDSKKNLISFAKLNTLFADELRKTLGY